MDPPSGFTAIVPTKRWPRGARRGRGFLAEVVEAWEGEIRPLTDRRPDVRVAVVRTGIVLARHGGALAKMLPLFRKSTAGRLGSGKQWMSWIHIRRHCPRISVRAGFTGDRHPGRGRTATRDQPRIHEIAVSVTAGPRERSGPFDCDPDTVWRDGAESFWKARGLSRARHSRRVFVTAMSPSTRPLRVADSASGIDTRKGVGTVAAACAGSDLALFL